MTMQVRPFLASSSADWTVCGKMELCQEPTSKNGVVVEWCTHLLKLVVSFKYVELNICTDGKEYMALCS